MKLVNDHVHGKVEIGRIDLMKNFSFFEVAEEEADRVIQFLNKVQVKGRRVNVEVATGETSEDKGKKNAKRRDSGRKEKDRDKKKQKSKAEKPEEGKVKKNKPSREERGYTAARGKKYTKEDWKQFFQPVDNRPLKGEEPDFTEEGWARRRPKK